MDEWVAIRRSISTHEASERTHARRARGYSRRRPSDDIANRLFLDASSTTNVAKSCSQSNAWVPLGCRTNTDRGSCSQRAEADGVFPVVVHFSSCWYLTDETLRGIRHHYLQDRPALADTGHYSRGVLTFPQVFQRPSLPCARLRSFSRGTPHPDNQITQKTTCGTPRGRLSLRRSSHRGQDKNELCT